MKQFGVIISSLLLASAFSLRAQAEEPVLSSYRAEIAVMSDRGIKLRADGQITFNNDGERWSLDVQAKGGPLTSRDTSRGEFVDNTYRPLSFNRSVKMLFYKEKMQWQFDWANSRVTGTVQGDTLSYPLDQIIHDQVSFQLPLRQGLMKGENRFDFRFFSYRSPRDLKFEIIGEELLSIGDGRAHTIILRQTQPSDADEKKLIWIATEYDYIPVRLSTFKKDKLKDDVSVTRLWIEGKAISFK